MASDHRGYRFRSGKSPSPFRATFGERTAFCRIRCDFGHFVAGGGGGGMQAPCRSCSDGHLSYTSVHPAGRSSRLDTGRTVRRCGLSGIDSGGPPSTPGGYDRSDGRGGRNRRPHSSTTSRPYSSTRPHLALTLTVLRIPHTSVCNQPPRPTQPPILCGTGISGNAYRPTCGDALRLGSKR